MASKRRQRTPIARLPGTALLPTLSAPPAESVHFRNTVDKGDLEEGFKASDLAPRAILQDS